MKDGATFQSHLLDTTIFQTTQEYITLITNFVNVTFVIGDHT